jgi:hypothetical protein
MDDSQKLQLQKMLSANQVEDCTDKIRSVKHSKQIRNDVQMLLKLKREYSRLAKSNYEQYEKICTSRCSFLFNNYTDIFNKVLKDELNLLMLDKILDKLQDIEDGRLDQHEASYEVGKLLKEMYIDSALRKSEKLDRAAEAKEKTKKPNRPPPKKLSWSQFKDLEEAGFKAK